MIDKEKQESSFERQLKEQFVDATGIHFERFLEAVRKEAKEEMIKEFEKMLTIGNICVILSGIKKPNKNGEIIIDAEQLRLTLDIIKQKIQELK